MALPRCHAHCSTKRRWQEAYVIAALIAGATMLMIVVELNLRRKGDQQHVGVRPPSQSLKGERFTHPLDQDSDSGRLSAEGQLVPVEGFGDANGSRVMPVGDHGDDADGLAQEKGAERRLQDDRREGYSEGDGDMILLPRCYTSPSADPSKGVWKKCENDVNESAVDMVNWESPGGEFAHKPGCAKEWVERQSDEVPMPYWEWQAEECWLEEVDAAKFCRVMEGRKGLMFVGDSLTRQMITTLASILRAEKFGSNSRCHDEWLACGGTLNMVFQRSDFLDTRTHTIPGVKYNNRAVDGPASSRCTVFADDDTLKNFDTLVVSSGAPTRRFDEYGPAMEKASKVLAASMKRLHGEDKTILVVRNTSPGHWECNQRMLNDPVEPDLAVLLNAAGKWDWSGFPKVNELLEKAFLGDPGDGWRLLDVYTPTVLRAESHVGGSDCLHYCIPGPVNHWVRLFYNMLAAEKAIARGGE